MALLNHLGQSDMNLEKHFTKFFALTSGGVIILSGVLLSLWWRQAAIDDLHVMAQRNNAALTQAFSNVVWGRFSDYVSTAGNMDADQLRAHPNTAELRKTILAQMKDISVLTVKIYDLNGLTVFSTEPAQIGSDKSQNPGYVSARSGVIASELFCLPEGEMIRGRAPKPEDFEKRSPSVQRLRPRT